MKTKGNIQMKRSCKFLIAVFVFNFTTATLVGQVDSILNRDFFVISTVGDRDTVGILEMRKTGLYQFKSLNNVDYGLSSPLPPIFLIQRSGKYKIQEVVKGSLIVDFCTDCYEEKNKSLTNKLAYELGINWHDGVCRISWLTSTFGGWYIVSPKNNNH